MENSKLIKLLKAFDHNKIHHLEKFICSGGGESARLFMKLKDHWPSFTNVTRENIYKRLTGYGIYNDKDMRYRMSNLVKEIEEFMVREDLEDSLLFDHYLFSAYYKKGLHKYAYQALRNFENSIDQTPEADAEHYRLRYMLSESRHKIDTAGSRENIQPGLKNVIEWNSISFLTTALKYHCEAVNRQNLTNEIYELDFIEHAIAYINKTPAILEHYPAIGIYYNILQTLTKTEAGKYYNELKILLGKFGDQFTGEELRDMYAFVQNYIIKQVNRGKTEYLKELFEVYSVLLEKELIFEEQYISQWDFKNIVTTALRLDKYDWAEHFIERYKDHLAPEFRNNAYTYNRAWVYFSRREHRKALKLLMNVEFTAIHYHLDSRSLLLKTYFELGEFEHLYSLAGAFLTYLRRNRKVTQYQKEIYRNLIKFVKEIAKIRQTGQKLPAQILHQLEQTNNVADALWLKKKLMELENKPSPANYLATLKSKG